MSSVRVPLTAISIRIDVKMTWLLCYSPVHDQDQENSAFPDDLLRILLAPCLLLPLIHPPCSLVSKVNQSIESLPIREKGGLLPLQKGTTHQLRKTCETNARIVDDLVAIPFSSLHLLTPPCLAHSDDQTRQSATTMHKRAT
jgi:hypothetical protein